VPDSNISRQEIEIFITQTERNRLDAFIWALLPESEFRNALVEQMSIWKRAYEQSLIRNMQQLDAALDISTLLENAGIKCIGLRGPFAGASLYEDIAIRYFTDIDLLIPADMRNNAWDILIAEGFKFSHPFMTRSASIRHHLEWPFRHEEKGISIDLHWAVDHPYKLYKINYSEIFKESYIYSCNEGKWRRPCALHEILLTALHVEKECRRKENKYNNKTILAEGAAGLWRHSLDLALLMRSQKNIANKLIVDGAKTWKASRTVESALKSAEILFPGKDLLESTQSLLKNDTIKEQKQNKTTDFSLVKSGRLERYGIRTECVHDVGRYLLPPASYFPKKHGLGLLGYRIIHIAQAICRLFVGILDFTWLRCRQIYLRWTTAHTVILMILSFSFESFAHDFGDDVGDTPSEAETIIVNSGSIQRVLEIDRDTDWYTFLIKPYVDYTISISKGSIFDLSLNRFARDGDSVLATTNTLPNYTVATNGWTGGSLMERAYIRVPGMSSSLPALIILSYPV
jgi:hypothetical protein